jgi:hypothetical protein
MKNKVLQWEWLLERITDVKAKAQKTHENGNECLISPPGGIPRVVYL